MMQQDLKDHIRQWKKHYSIIASCLGDIPIGKPLGEGGNALVYESSFAKGVAVKFLAEEVTDPFSSRYARFLDEYRNLFKLASTGTIVPLYQFGIQDMDGKKIPYIIMEKCVQTLYQAYKVRKLANEAEFGSLLSRLLDILEVLHNHGIVHRDIKPQNILLRPSGEWVLGDFGIAWFDQDLHMKVASTEKNERLANFEFSAPEQIKRQNYDKPVPSMDLYALGQTLYYCVTGNAIRGAAYPRFKQVASNLADFDPFIENLVKQQPQERLQSVREVREFLEKQKEEASEKIRDRNESNKLVKFYKQQEAFDDILRLSSPGKRNFVQANKKEEIERILSNLAENSEKCDLWWFRGLGQFEAQPIKKLSDEIWLIYNFECKIIDLWIYKNERLEKQFIIVHLAPMPTFGVYDMSSYSEEVDLEEVGYFQGSYITREEYDDGYALINGESVRTINAEIRVRNRFDDFLIFAPNLSCYNHGKNDNLVNSVYEKLKQNKGISKELLEPLKQIERTDWMKAWD